VQSSIVASVWGRITLVCLIKIWTARAGDLERFDSNVPPRTVTGSHDHDCFTNGWFHQCSSSSMEMFEGCYNASLSRNESTPEEAPLSSTRKVNAAEAQRHPPTRTRAVYRHISCSNGRCRRPCSDGTKVVFMLNTPEEATRR